MPSNQPNWAGNTDVKCFFFFFFLQCFVGVNPDDIGSIILRPYVPKAMLNRLVQICSNKF